MAEKGKKPAMNIWAGGCRYQGMSVGISRGTLFVRQGVSSTEVEFRPMMPPSTCNGNAISSHMLMMAMMVCQGRAAVEAADQATEFTQLKTASSGAGKARAESMMFHTQDLPSSCLYRRALR
mmetsp:Transcript_56524/g.129805  ORF Transcript_56524/g.129805 Transcript_56524/m.129805 type:complete len:122 (-) Transcript_56524:558-923(-)